MAYYNALMKGGRVTRNRIKKEEDKRDEIWTNKIKPAKSNRVVLLELEKWLKTLILKNFQESRL